jgi:hypothetical protein
MNLFSPFKVDFDFCANTLKGIAEGMVHLGDNGIIHRDLAARNILVKNARNYFLHSLSFHPAWRRHDSNHWRLWTCESIGAFR